MTPGRSLLAKTSGRSMAPVASTTCFARTRHSRWRGSGRRGVPDARSPAPSASGSCGRSSRTRWCAAAASLPACGRVRPAHRRPTRSPACRRSVRRSTAASRRVSACSSARMTRAPGAAGGECRGETGGPAAHHQHVAMGEGLAVAIGVGRFRRLAEARGTADEILVFHPEARRPHEGLVVEAGREIARRADC